ncbi:hypothetical protein B6I21_02000 [candidate division KSB1 bacterium 4572_119]|nr:MAG: hypothetical protein B6I21_02000 [candidate division KSB1 bacterium 4572_119]
MFYSLFRLIDFFINLYIFIIIFRVVLSWIPHNPHQTFVRIIFEITEPPLQWIRQWLPNFGGLDLSPAILIFGIIIARRFLSIILL